MKSLVFVLGLAMALGSVGVAAASTNQAAPQAATPKGSAIVKAGLLTIDDFPPGWAQSPRESSSSGDLDLSSYGKACAALQKIADRTKKLRTGHGQSPDFKQGSTDQIDNTVTAYPTPELAKTALSIFKRPAVAGCLQKWISDRAAATAPDGVSYKVSIGRLSVPPVGDDTVGYEISLVASKNGLSIHLLLDLQLVLVGQAGMTFSFQGEGTSPMLDNQDLVEASVARVQAAESGA